MELPIIIKLILAVLLGAFIGIERETAPREAGSEESKYEFVAGVRSHALIGLLGVVLGIMVTAGFSAIAWIIAVAFLGLLVLSYAFMAFRVNAPGITSELAIIFTFLTGFLLSLDIIPIHIIIALTIILSFILSRKESIHNWMKSIQRKEIYAVVSFAIISLVILPFLPNESYALGEIGFVKNIVGAYNINMGRLADVDLVNPFTLWLVVVLICGISLVSHLLGRMIGKRNALFLTSIAGGLVSSTAVTIALAKKSKGARFSAINYFAAASVSATLVSFITLMIIISPFSKDFLMKATLMLLPMSVVGIFGVLWMLHLSKNCQETTISVSEGAISPTVVGEKIFSIEDGLKFAAFLLGVKALTRFALVFLGTSAFIASSLLASFAGVDPVAINIAEMSSSLITIKMALMVFLLINGVNFLAKVIYTFWLGEKRVAIRMLGVFSAMFIAGLGWFLFVG